MPTAQEQAAKTAYEQAHAGYRVTSIWTTQEGEIMGEVYEPGAQVGQAQVVRLYHPGGVGVGEITGGYVAGYETRPEYKQMQYREAAGQTKRIERIEAGIGRAYETFRGEVAPPITEVKEETYRMPWYGGEWERVPGKIAYYQMGKKVGEAQEYAVIPREELVSRLKREISGIPETPLPLPFTYYPTGAKKFYQEQIKPGIQLAKWAIVTPFKAADVALKPISESLLAGPIERLKAAPMQPGVSGRWTRWITLSELETIQAKPVSYPATLYATYGIGKVLGKGAFMFQTSKLSAKFPLVPQKIMSIAGIVGGGAYGVVAGVRGTQEYITGGEKAAVLYGWKEVKTLGLLHIGARKGFAEQKVMFEREWALKTFGKQAIVPQTKPVEIRKMGAKVTISPIGVQKEIASVIEGEKVKTFWKIRVPGTIETPYATEKFVLRGESMVTGKIGEKTATAVSQLFLIQKGKVPVPIFTAERLTYGKIEVPLALSKARMPLVTKQIKGIFSFGYGQYLKMTAGKAPYQIKMFRTGGISIRQPLTAVKPVWMKAPTPELQRIEALKYFERVRAMPFKFLKGYKAQLWKGFTVTERKKVSIATGPSVLYLRKPLKDNFSYLRKQDLFRLPSGQATEQLTTQMPRMGISIVTIQDILAKAVPISKLTLTKPIVMATQTIFQLKIKTKQVIKPVSRQIIRTKLKISSRVETKAKERVKGKAIMQQALALSPVEISKYRYGVVPTLAEVPFQLIRPIQRQIQRQIPIAETPTEVIQRQVTRYTPPRTLPPSLPLLPLSIKPITGFFGFNWPKMKRQISWKRAVVPRKYRYQPQLAATVLDIRMPITKYKMPKLFTGLELRPLLVPARRKKKR